MINESMKEEVNKLASERMDEQMNEKTREHKNE